MYNEKITKVSINFRNGEVLDIPAEMVNIITNGYDKTFRRQTSVGFGSSEVYNFVYININSDFHLNTRITRPYARFKNFEEKDTLDRAFTGNDVQGIIFYEGLKMVESFSVPWPANIFEDPNDDTYTVLSNPLQVNRINGNNDLEIMIATNESMEKNKFNISCYQDKFNNLEVMASSWERIYEAEKIKQKKNNLHNRNIFNYFSK